MTHDEILKAARERIAEIDAQIAGVVAERAKLKALLGQASPTLPATVTIRPVLPWVEPIERDPHPWIPAQPYITYWGDVPPNGEMRIGDTSGTGCLSSTTAFRS